MSNYYEDPGYTEYGNYNDGYNEYEPYSDYAEPDHWEPEPTPSEPDHHNHEYNDHRFIHEQGELEYEGDEVHQEMEYEHELEYHGTETDNGTHEPQGPRCNNDEALVL